MEAPEQDPHLREPHGLTVWDDAEHYPWGPMGENERGEAIKLRAVRYAEQHATVQLVSYQHLIAVEPSVYRAKVAHYRAHPSADRPFVFKHNGKLILWDGTHRVTALMAAGQDRGPADVVDLDEVLTPEGRVKHPERFTVQSG